MCIEPTFSNREIQIRAFRSDTDTQLCHSIANFHDEALSRYAVDGLHAADRSWIGHTNTIAIVAESTKNGEMCGGIRLQLADTNRRLPTDAAVGALAPRLRTRIDDHLSSTAEICGLWRATHEANRELVMQLSTASMALAHRLGIREVWGLAPQHTLKHWQTMGYRVDARFGDSGGFAYPDERYWSCVVRLDSEHFAHTPHDLRTHILSIDVTELLDSESVHQLEHSLFEFQQD